jgi:hypothetical protein
MFSVTSSYTYFVLERIKALLVEILKKESNSRNIGGVYTWAGIRVDGN